MSIHQKNVMMEIKYNKMAVPNLVKSKIIFNVLVLTIIIQYHNADITQQYLYLSFLPPKILLVISW